MKHTPGPWKVDQNDEYPGNYIVREFCNLWDENEAIWDTDDPQQFTALCQEDDANARLIAAAPELLEACKIGAELWHDSSTGLVCDDEEICPFCKAIAKAERRE